MKILEDKIVKCQICNKEFKDLSGLNKHISISHRDLDTIKYYLQFIKPTANTNCRFCGEPTQFKGFTNGFKINCNDRVCVKKAFAPFSKEYKIKVDGLSENEYEKWSIEDKIIKKKNTEEGFKKKREIDANFDKKNSRYCKEYWAKKGYNEDDSIRLAYLETAKSRDKLKEIKKINPDYQKGKSWNSKYYWINKGYTKDDAIATVSKKQSTFSLEKCIEKFGEDEGKIRWKDRQEKWLKNLDSKSDDEKFEILKKKIMGNKRYSLISQELFFSIIEKFTINKNECFFAENNGEKDILNNKIIFKPDFVYKEKIIEFFGDYWHCNPISYLDESKKIRRGSKKYTVASIRKIDEFRLKLLRKAGYKVMIVWEKDYRNNKKNIINECIKFLEND